MKPILSDLPFASGDEVLLFVNGMGGHAVCWSFTSCTAGQKKLPARMA